MINKNRISRREFFKKAGTVTGAAAIGSIPLINACKGGSTTPTTPSQKVSVKIQFYNHTHGPQIEKTYEGMSGSYFIVKIGELGIASVTSTRIAVRQAGNTETMGSLIKFSLTEEVSLKYPEKNESWEAYLMNSGNGTSYDLIDRFEGFGSLVNPRNTPWHREDVEATGPEEPLLEAVRQLNEALDYPWKKYGSFIKTDNQGLGMGYKTLGEPAHYDNYVIFIDPEFWNTSVEKLKGFINYIFREATLIGYFNRVEPYNYICDQSTGNLNAIGRDMMAYVYVRDGHFD